MFGIIQQQKQTLENLRSNFTFQVQKTERLEAIVSSLAGSPLNNPGDSDSAAADERRIQELEEEIVQKQEELGRLSQKKKIQPENRVSHSEVEAEMENTIEQEDSSEGKCALL